jgi:hypothetical protein
LSSSEGDTSSNKPQRYFLFPTPFFWNFFNIIVVLQGAKLNSLQCNNPTFIVALFFQKTCALHSSQCLEYIVLVFSKF